MRRQPVGLLASGWGAELSYPLCPFPLLWGVELFVTGSSRLLTYLVISNPSGFSSVSSGTDDSVAVWGSVSFLLSPLGNGFDSLGVGAIIKTIPLLPPPLGQLLLVGEFGEAS